MLNPSSLLAFCVVAFWSFVVEAGVVALLLAFRGAAPLQVFVAYFVANAAVFFILFQPLLMGSNSPPVLALEALVVLIDGLIIKLLVTLNPFQGDNYRGVSWLRSTVISGTRLKAQTEGLRSQLAEATQGQQANVAAPDNSELEQLRRDNADLLRLRAEVTTLRQQVASMPNNQNDPNARARSLKQATEEAEGKALLAKSPEIALVPAHLWANVGYATLCMANCCSRGFGHNQKAKSRVE